MVRPVIAASGLVRERGVQSLSELLTGRVPGLLVVPGSGVNGMGARIRSRGVQSLGADRAPLVLVDGVRIDATEDDFSPDIPWGFPFARPAPPAPGPLRLDDINPEDVDSVEVLLGAASTALYGPGADEGVLLVHTKRGRPGPPRWEAYAAGGLASEPTAWPASFGGVDPGNPDSAYRHGACTLTAQAAGRCLQDYVQQFNPLVERSPFRTALRRTYGISVSGGSGWGDYRLAGEFAGDGGPYSSSVASPDPNYFRRLNGRASARLRPWSGVEIGVTAVRVTSRLRLPPSRPLEEGTVGSSDSAGFAWSPLFEGKAGQVVERALGVIDAQWSPLSWLTLRGLAGMDAVHQRDSALPPSYPGGSISPREGRRETRHRTLELGASVTHAFSAALRSTTTLGVQHLRDTLDHRWTAPYASAEQITRRHSLGYYVEQRLDFGERFFLSGAVRHDHFKEEHRGAAYPALAVSWVAHAADSGRFSLLRLRAAYGAAGPRPFEGLREVFVPIGTPLPEIKPERTTSTEYGADAALLAGRLTARLTYYRMRSRVVWVPEAMPGVGRGIAWPGTISNRGVEASVSGKVLTGPGLSWDVVLSLWGNRNRLAKFELGGFPFGIQRAALGYPVGGYWVPGINSYADANGDGIIVVAEVVGSTPVWAGTPYPTQGAMVSSEWAVGRWFRTAATLEYRGGQSLFNRTAYWRCFFGVCRAANDPRTPLGEQARAVSGLTTGYVEDAAYLKLRELSFSLTAPPALAAAVRARGATVTLAGRNLATWTGYSGPDPEAGSYGTLPPDGPRTVADFATLPVPRSWTLRIDLTY